MADPRAGDPVRVLYVDDDRVVALLFEEAARHAGGFDVEVAETGAEALALARGERYDLLVVDLHLPDTTGHALLPALFGALAPPPPPAYLCTADTDASVDAAARAAGFDGCWAKPVSVEQMQAAAAACAARRRNHRAE